MSSTSQSLVQGVTFEILKVTVDCDLTFDQMIAAGKYDWQNNNINETNFPFQGRGKIIVDAYLTCFNRFMDYDEIPLALDSCGLKEGVLPVLLAVGKEHPNKQVEFPIVETGSIWPDLQRGGRRGVYLRRGNKERGLAFIWLDHGFPGYYRILAIKKDIFFN